MNWVAICMYALSLLVGFGVGLLFYMGLWWTIRQLASSKYAAIWFCLSFLVRIGGAAVLFFLIGNNDICRYGFLLLGFVLAKKIAVARKTAR